jgi:hypothetical protein
MQTKDEAYRFLCTLQTHLNEYLPEGLEISRKIGKIINEDEYRVSDWQDAFSILVTPYIHEFLCEHGMSSGRARDLFLSEMHGQIPQWVGGPVARSEGHPFTKNDIGIKPKVIIDRWRGNKKGLPCPRPCPDMAFRAPYKVVFEVKYFRQNQSGSADSELVKGIFEAFFYRSLPLIPETPRRAAWDYDYSCFLAYDATVEGNLLHAWNSLDKIVRKGFWDGANIYIMILRSRK